MDRGEKSMNANELADELEDDYWDSRARKIMLEGAKMLRQQQAEIEALKNKIKSYENLGNMMLDQLLEKAQEKWLKSNNLTANPIWK